MDENNLWGPIVTDAHKDVRKLIEYNYDDEVMIFSGPDYDRAFLGISECGRAVYDYDIMVKQIMDDDGLDVMDAVEFI